VKQPQSKILVIDDLITPTYQNALESLVQSKAFPWSFESSTLVQNNSSPPNWFADKNTAENFQFTHTLYNHYDKNASKDSFFDLFLPILFTLQDKIQQHTNLIRLKTNMLTQSTPVSAECHHTAHIDDYNPHIVMIYYINESDGDTVIFNETYGSTFDSLTVKQRVSPKKGRAVVFSGNHFHASSSPLKTPVRLVLNCTLATGKI
jgi:hypothetical protein